MVQRGRDQDRDHSVFILIMPVMGGDEEMKIWARVLLIRKARKDRKYMCLQEGLINYSRGAKSSPLLVFKNKVLLEHSLVNLFIYCLWLLTKYSCRVKWLFVCLIFIYLFGALCLSCGTTDSLSLLQHVEYLEVSCRIQSPDQELNLGPLHLKYRAFVNGPPGKSPGLRSFDRDILTQN